MNKTILITIVWLGWHMAAPAIGADFIARAGVKPALQSVSQSSPPVQSQAELIRLTTLLVAANRFKQISLGDYEKALVMFATEDAIAKFREFNKHIWVETSPKMGWSYFMSSSVHAVGGAGRQQPLVAFYNPWSDVFLITEWQIDQAVPRLVDAEMLMGDWLREGNQLSPVPHWLRTDIFKPAALGASVAQSIQLFEQRFQSTGTASSWRKRLPVLENTQLLTELNYPAVALMLLGNLQNINEFRTLKKETNPRMAACRGLAIEVVRSGARGQLKETRKTADETLASTWSVLESLNRQWFEELEAVAVINGKDGCLVFLSPVFDTSGSLSLLFKGSKATLRLKRIDVIDYSGFYRSILGDGEAPRKELAL